MAKVLFVAPIYNYYPILAHALVAQTVSEWELLLLHDGPNATGLAASLRQLGDPRVRYYESPTRYNDWGHSLRAMGLEQIATEPIEGDFVVVTNGDNYYCPGFVETMLRAFESSVVAVYCPMIHNHYGWRLIDSRLEHKWIDCGCLMARRDVAINTGWTSREYSADWSYVSQMIGNYGAHRIKRIDNILFVHN